MKQALPDAAFNRRHFTSTFLSVMTVTPICVEHVIAPGLLQLRRRRGTAGAFCFTSAMIEADLGHALSIRASLNHTQGQPQHD